MESTECIAAHATANASWSACSTSSRRRDPRTAASTERASSSPESVSGSAVIVILKFYPKLAHFRT